MRFTADADSVAHTCLSSSRVVIRRVCGGGGGNGETKAFEIDDVGAVTGAIGAAGTVGAVTVIGASRSGSVIVVSWEVFMPEASKSELASGDTDLRSPVVGWDADGSSWPVVSIIVVACAVIACHFA